MTGTNSPQYAIVIFPKFDDRSQIDQLRIQFDPLASHLDPHITLVFPFETDLSIDRLGAHIQRAVQGIKPFKIRLQGITGSEGEYLFLNVKRGNDHIIVLHDHLYTGSLQTYLIREHTYLPHMTVGRLTDQVTFRNALEKSQRLKLIFNLLVEELALIRVGDIYPILASFELIS